jgi:hypothetical protein
MAATWAYVIPNLTSGIYRITKAAQIDLITKAAQMVLATLNMWINLSPMQVLIDNIRQILSICKPFHH